jgi:hypothetical protein
MVDFIMAFYTIISFKFDVATISVNGKKNPVAVLSVKEKEYC